MADSAFEKFVTQLPANYFRSQSEKDTAHVAFTAGVTLGAFGVVADTARNFDHARDSRADGEAASGTDLSASVRPTVTLCEQNLVQAVDGSCPIHGGDACLAQYRHPSNPVSRSFLATDLPYSGELLNDEYELRHHPLAPFDSNKYYLVRHSFKGREVLGEWEP